MVIQELASSQGRQDEEPNIALTQRIAATGDGTAVKELVEHLFKGTTAIQNDCIKVIYEVGGLRPELIQDYAPEFVQLLRSKNNRLVWGAMTALGAIAPFQAETISQHIDAVIEATATGSVITQDWGVRVLATVLVKQKNSAPKVLPFLTNILRACAAKDVPRHAESMLAAADRENRQAIVDVLKHREPELSAAQAKRLAKVVQSLNAL